MKKRKSIQYDKLARVSKSDAGDLIPSASLNRRHMLAATAGIVASTGLPAPAGVIQNRRAARSRRPSYTSLEKQQAIVNYQTSLAAYGGRLSSPMETLFRRKTTSAPYDIDIAVIGSGYGGGITAARLAQQMKPGVRLCVFERGKEWIPGTFSDNLRGGFRENRQGVVGRRKGTVRRPGGLVDFCQSDDLNVLTGNGLGGTSLINANVVIKADPEVFQQKHWPAALRHREVLDPFYDASGVELGAVQGPWDSSPKMIAQRRAASRLAVSDRQFFAANLAVTFDQRFLDHNGRNLQGMIQAPCILCGDCMSGCNTGSKNTVQMNYLPLAKRHGAEIFTNVECKWIEKCNGYYRLHFVSHQSSSAGSQSIPFTRTARIVVLSAGSLGSTGILLRSRDRDLPLSPAVGERWSGNGDAIGFITRTQQFTNSAGSGAYQPSGPPEGLAIQTITRVHGGRSFPYRVLVQDGNMPRSFANLIGTVMRDLDFDSTLILFAMGHDGSRGRVVMKNDLPVVSWPGHSESAYRNYVLSHFEMMAAAHGGQYRKLRLFGRQGISAHPLGGCNMADDPGQGVVNDRGQVFDGLGDGYVDARTGEATVHHGLYVADGGVIPTSLGANPLWTISAVSERIAAGIAMEPDHQDLFGR